MPIIQYSNIPATDKELESNSPYTFSIDKFNFYRFKMAGLPLTEFYETDKLLKTSIFYVLNHNFSKTEFKKLISLAMQNLNSAIKVVDLVDIIYNRVLPIPLWVSISMIGLYNFRFWRYPKKWLFSMKKFFRMNLDSNDIPDLATHFLNYSIEVKKKLENILLGRMDGNMSIKEDLKTSNRLADLECDPVFLSAGHQLFGRPVDWVISKKRGLVA